jgi:uncharacterized protein YvpB
MAPILKTTRETIFKQKPLQSSTLPEAERYPVAAGTQFELHSYLVVRNHVRFALLNQSFKGLNTWYAYGQHIEIVEMEPTPRQIYPKPIPEFVKLPIPYKSQLDNWYNPTGACNVTSLAMCLEYLKTPRRISYGQFEDELYEYAINKAYSRWDPIDLAKIVRDYGRQDTFKFNGTLNEVKEWVAEGNPAVIHGYFTSFGHILVVVGYDEYGLIVHDPYGEWFPSGYRTDLSGAYLHYSYRLIRRACMPDGDFWVHFISK